LEGYILYFKGVASRRNFFIENISPGSYTLEVEYVSFQRKQFKNLKIDREQNSMLIRLN
jgi:hypothetical protein